MNILMTSIYFYPHIGGIETVTEFLASEFSRMGHNVKVVTTSPCDNEHKDKTFNFEIIRQPKAKELLAAYTWCDVFVHQGISLKWVWPLLIRRRPWFIVYHQGGYQPGILGKLKRLCSHFAHNIVVSETSRKGYGLKRADVINNSFSSDTFVLTNPKPRKGFVFVGRLMKDKGILLLLEAYNKFKSQTGSDWKLTYVGGGAHEAMLDEAIAQSPYKEDIIKLGFKYPHEVAEILNQNQVQVVPSIYTEAFGIVVLEGMSCGCIVIGSDGDGIAEAMGSAGFQFHKGDADSLCQVLVRTSQLTDAEYQEQRKLMKENVERLSLNKVASRYIEVFERVLNK